MPLSSMEKDIEFLFKNYSKVLAGDYSYPDKVYFDFLNVMETSRSVVSDLSNRVFESFDRMISSDTLFHLLNRFTQIIFQKRDDCLYFYDMEFNDKQDIFNMSAGLFCSTFNLAIINVVIDDSMKSKMDFIVDNKNVLVLKMRKFSVISLFSALFLYVVSSYQGFSVAESPENVQEAKLRNVELSILAGMVSFLFFRLKKYYSEVQKENV